MTNNRSLTASKEIHNKIMRRTLTVKKELVGLDFCTRSLVNFNRETEPMGEIYLKKCADLGINPLGGHTIHLWWLPNRSIKNNGQHNY
jgi:hypothetical protein